MPTENVFNKSMHLKLKCLVDFKTAKKRHFLVKQQHFGLANALFTG